MNEYFIVVLRKGSITQEFVVNNVSTSESAVSRAKREVTGLGWVVAAVSSNLLTSTPTKGLTS